MTSLLADVTLFQALPKRVLKRLGELCELRRFRKGEQLFGQGDPAKFIWIVKHGWVFLVKHTPRGIPVTVFTVTPEDMLCGYSAVVGRGGYFASALAATDTTAIRMAREDFARLLREQAGFAEQVLAIYHTRMRHMAEAITLAQAPSEQRLAYVLLRLHQSFGHVIPLTHHELARMSGMRLETSIRVVAVFKQKRWLSTSRAKMTILNAEGLKTVLQS